MLFEFLSEAFNHSLFVIFMLSSEYYCKITGKHPMQLAFPIVVAVKYWIEF